MKRIILFLFNFLFLWPVMGQSVENSIVGTNISEVEIENAIKEILGPDFSFFINNPGVDIRAIITEQLERELVKAAAGSSITSVSAVAIMDAYDQLQKGKLAGEIANLRDVLDLESQKILRLQQNLIRLKMQNRLGGSSMPSSQIMQSFAIKDLQKASASDLRMNDILTKSGTGVNLSVYDRIKLSEKINGSIKNKTSQDAVRQVIKSSNDVLVRKLENRNSKTKQLLMNK